MKKLRSMTFGSQSDLRQGNLTTLMQYLQQQPSLTRSDLATATGLNRATITRLIADLSGSGFVRENGLESSGPGRPSIPLEINPEAGYLIGAEIGSDFLTVILSNFAHEILWYDKRNFVRGSDFETVLPDLIKILVDAIKQIENPLLPLYGISIGLQGLVNSEDNILLYAPNLNWRDIRLGDLLSQEFDVPIYIDNVASLSAFGESYSGVAATSSHVLYISTQYGIGGRHIINNTVLRGANGVAGEIGHMTIDVNGKQCTCGKKGCWETVASQKAALDYTRELLNEGHVSIIPELLNGNLDELTIRVLVDAIKRDDALAQDVLNKTGYYLGVGIANLVNALNPHLIVLGGELSIAGEYLLPHIKTVVAEQALQWSYEDCEILIAKHGSNATLMGAVARVHQETLHNLEIWIS